MQKADSNSSAGTGADSEQKVEDIFVSSNDTKPLVVGSQSHGIDVSSLNGLDIYNKESLIQSIQNSSPSFYEIINTIFSKSNKVKCY